jgi:hypothetical protein
MATEGRMTTERPMATVDVAMEGPTAMDPAVAPVVGAVAVCDTLQCTLQHNFTVQIILYCGVYFLEKYGSV